MEFKSNLNDNIPIMEDCKFNRLIEEIQRRQIRELRDKYFHDNDFDYLSRGVTWACNYCAMHRLKLNIFPK